MPFVFTYKLPLQTYQGQKTRPDPFIFRAFLANNVEQTWAIGQLVDVAVPLKSKGDVLLENRDALILRKKGPHIVKIDNDNDNKALQIPVKVGNGKDKLVEVTPTSKITLNAGDKVAVRGAEQLQTGQEVEVQVKQ